MQSQALQEMSGKNVKKQQTGLLNMQTRIQGNITASTHYTLYTLYTL